MSGIKEGLGNVVSTITSSISNVITTITDTISDVIDSINDVIESILSIPQTLIDLLSELLQFLFVPEDEFFSDKILYFREKFGFVDSIFECIEVIKFAFENPTEFGSLTIDLSDNRSSIPLGIGKINVLNVSWYSEYKPVGDKIVGAFMWLVFIFNVFKQLPGIISGTSGAVVQIDSIEKGQR